MAKIIAFGEFQSKLKQEKFERNLQTEIEKVEELLNIEDPLLVLTDNQALTIGNCLLDARAEIDRVLDILNISESEELPDGLR